MKLYIPDIGDKITLSSDWDFKLYRERRNDKLLKAFNYSKGNWSTDEYYFVTLPKGIVLVVDRIYIRKGAHMAGYSSVTFKVESTLHKEFNKARFWVKLSDCNNIEFETPKLAKRLEKIKLHSIWHYALAESQHVFLNKNEITEIKNIFKPKNVFFVKNSNLYVDGIKVDISPKLLSLFTINAASSLQDANPNSNVKNKILKISYRREFVDIVAWRNHHTSRLGNLLSPGGDDYELRVKNTYILNDGDILIGEYKTASTMLKHAKDYLEKLRIDPAYESVSNFKDLFS